MRTSIMRSRPNSTDCRALAVSVAPSGAGAMYVISARRVTGAAPNVATQYARAVSARWKRKPPWQISCEFTMSAVTSRCRVTAPSETSPRVTPWSFTAGSLT